MGCLWGFAGVDILRTSTEAEGPQDSREPGSTRLQLESKKATARREKAEEALKQAQEALEQARLQETRAIKELEDAKAAAAPAPPPETPPPGSVSLSSDDVAGLILLPRACGRKGGRQKGAVGAYGKCQI